MTRFVLPPKMMQARNWVRSTDALRNALRARLESIQDRAAAKRKEAEEIEQEGTSIVEAIALLDRLLPPAKAKAGALPAAAERPGFTVDRIYQPPPPPSLTGQVAPTMGRWSVTVPACVKCGTTEKKHAARGLCTVCYWHDTHPVVTPESPTGRPLIEFLVDEAEANAEAVPVA